MNGAPYIPAKTAEKMGEHPVKGTRHAALIDIAMSLLGNGMSRDAVFAQCRSTVPDADKTDKAIWGIIDWCEGKGPTPSGFGDSPPPVRTAGKLALQKPAQPKLTPKQMVARCIGDQKRNEIWWGEQCQLLIPGDPVEQATALFRALYEPEERVNLVKEFFIGDDGKAKPHGAGKSFTRDQWIAHFEMHGMPKSDSGVWIRPNPCGEGTGKDGAVTDADILSFRFTLLESDELTMEEQLSLYARTGLPIAAIVTSGGTSGHAWVRIDASDLEQYRERVKALYEALEGFGMDRANKNASRLSRLAGAHRTLGVEGGGLQRVIYINPEARGDVLTAGFLLNMRALLMQPPVPMKPLREAICNAHDRYLELAENKGKNGVPTGIPSFDTRTGGLKKKRFYVLAAESKCGKSSLAFNIARVATVGNKIPTAVFSMEMDSDEIVDMLMSMEGRVNRNCFNTGDFSDFDMQGIKKASPILEVAPLYIFDNPEQTIDSIRADVKRLKGSVNLGLIIVDYIQLVTPTGSDAQSREQQIAAIGKGLRALCVEANAPVLALSQLNDEGRLRESRALAHAAHGVFILEEIEPSIEDTPERLLRLKLERARAMPRGTYPIVFEPYYCRMYEGNHETEIKPKVQQGDLRRKR